MIDTRIQINVICDKCGATEEFEAVVPRKDNIAKPEDDIWDIEDQCLTALEIDGWGCADDATQKCPECAEETAVEFRSLRRKTK